MSGEGDEYDEGEYEPQYDDNFLEEGAPEEYYEGEGGEGEGPEININIPAEEDYPAFDEIGLTDDAIRIVQDFVLSNGHLRLTAEDLADVMRDVDGQENPESIEFARMVLDVWRMRNPDLEAIDEEYPRDQPPEPTQQQDGVIEYDDDPYITEAQQDDPYGEYQPPPQEGYAEYEPAPEEYDQAPEEYAQAPEEYYEPPLEEFEPQEPVEEYYEPEPQAMEEDYAPPVMHATQMDAYDPFESQPQPSQPEVIYDEPAPVAAPGQYVIHPPRIEDFPYYDDRVDFASRLVENFLVTNGHLKLAPQELAVSLLELDGVQMSDAENVAAVVLDVWSLCNPEFEVLPRAPKPVEVQLRQQQLVEAVAVGHDQVLITVPSDDEYPPCAYGGMISSAVRVVRNFVMQNSTLAITAQEVAAQMTECGGDRWVATIEAAEAVLAAWKRRNPQLPLVAPQPPPEIILEEPPKEHGLTSIQLPGGATLVIPPETDYECFDRSGLTDDAIRIIREFVTETGSLGITEELVAAQMLDFMGNRSPEAQPIARMVLGVWRMRNPALPLTTVKEIYPGVIDSEAAAPSSAAPSASASVEITKETSKNAVILENAPATPPVEEHKPASEPLFYGVNPKESLFVDRDDSRDFVYGPELFALLDTLGCAAETYFSETFGPGIRFTMISSNSMLYKSGVDPGDAIVAVDGMRIIKPSQLYTVLSRKAPGARFTWRLRRVSITGNCSEWCVIQTMSQKKQKAIEPRFAGLPRAEQYRSHSGMLPANPGFRERYAQVPDYFVQVPEHRPTKKYWDTRVVQCDSVVVEPVLAIEGGPRAIEAPHAIGAPPMISPAAEGGTRTVYPLEGKPYTVPLTTPYTAATSGRTVQGTGRTAYSTSPARAAYSSSHIEQIADESLGKRVVYPLQGAPYTVPLSGPLPVALSGPSALNAPIRTVMREQPTKTVVVHSPPKEVGIPLAMSAPSRTEIVLPTDSSIADVRARMLQKYQATISTKVHVTEDRIPVSEFMRPEIIGSPRSVTRSSVIRVPGSSFVRV